MLSSLSPSAPVAADEAVKDVGMASFVADVIEASKTALVLVDFWATWCGPCKQLTPVLEKIVRESKGAIKLAKVDVDRNQPIAQQMGVQSVPSVFAFFNGRPVDAFAGALPEKQIKTWLEPLLKNAGLGDDEKMGVETALAQAAEYLAEPDIVTARAIYVDLFDIDPTCAPAYAGIIRCALAEGDTAQARKLLDATPAALVKDKALDAVRAALELAEQAGQGSGEITSLEVQIAATPDDHQARYDLALAYYAVGKREEAVDQLLEIVKRARTWNDDAARKQLVKFFEAFGVMDPVTIAARKRLSSLLFS